MEPVRNISAQSGFAAKQFAVLTPFITLAMVAICAVQLGWMGWMVGLPPAEVAFGFIQAAALPVAGGVALLAIIALSFAAIACFGGWCLSQPTARLGFSQVLPWTLRLLRFLAASPWRLSNDTHRVACLTPTDGLFSFFSSRRRRAAPVAAALAGASPLLE